MRKRIICGIVVVLTLLFGNGCYYVFYGQNLSTKKLLEGRELIFYEMCSIYTIHTALWSLSWPLSPQAARECFLLHFSQKDIVTIRMNLSSPKIEAIVRSLKDRQFGSYESLARNGNEAYSLSSPEHKVAIAVNPCRVEKELQESLLRYLQDKGWPSCFTARYRVRNNSDAAYQVNNNLNDNY